MCSGAELKIIDEKLIGKSDYINIVYLIKLKLRKERCLLENNKLETISNLFEGKEIRSTWDAEKEEYFFSVIDVIGALTDSKIPRNYWSDLKRKLADEGSQLHEKIVQLKLRSNKDGKKYIIYRKL